AAVRAVVGDARPAAFDEPLVGFLEAGGGLHTGLGPGAALEVTGAVQRSDDLLADLGALFQNGVDHVRGGVLAAREALIVRFVAEQFVANEADITQGGLVLRHSGKPLRWIP